MASEVGLPRWFAEAGAGAFQVWDHLYNLKGNVGGIATWFDDPADNYWIRYGYEYAQTTSGRITTNNFSKFLKDYILNTGTAPEPISPGVYYWR